MCDVRRLSDSTLKELWTVMNDRMASIARGESSEEEYETQQPDWQNMYNQIKQELTNRKLI